MLFCFVDETSDYKFKDYLGISLATISSTKYPVVKREFQSILRDSDWDESIEFKGSHLFSARSGDVSVEIEDRIEIAEKLLDLNVSKKNARINFFYLRHKAEPASHGKEYLRCLPLLLKAALKKPPKGVGKNVLSVACDYRTDIDAHALRASIRPTIEERGYVLFEQPTLVTSNFHTVGVLYADIVGYLAARVDTISNDAELFEGLTQEQLESNGKVRKLRSSAKLIQKVKNLGLFEVKAR